MARGVGRWGLMLRMTTKLWIGLVLGLAGGATAQDAANPFIEKDGEAKKEPQKVGVPCELIVEHVLVAEEPLNAWQDEHGTGDDEALHAQVRVWLKEGVATLDHTAVTCGTTESALGNETILEQIYATEYMAGGHGAWPVPTSFETRNTGYSANGRMVPKVGGMGIEVETEFVEIMPHRFPHPLVERTREADDVFIPRFRTFRSEDGKSQGDGWDDPFAAPNAVKPKPSRPDEVIFRPGKIMLGARYDALEDATDGMRWTRLVFVKGNLGERREVADPPTEAGLEVRVLRVPHAAFSDWLWAHEGESADLAWEAAKAWQPEEVGGIGGRLDIRGVSTFENIVEYVYPTEWIPGNETTVIERWEEAAKRGDKDGVAIKARKRVEPAKGAEDLALATSFETRNLGLTVETKIEGDRLGLVIDRVVHVGDSVHHRVQDGVDWVADVTHPRMAKGGIEVTLPLMKSGWRLAGAGSEFGPDGRADKEHRLLFFVKVE